jgi:hypothetical protein
MARQPTNLAAIPSPPGYQVFKVQEGVGHVVVARTNPDGTVTAKCLDSPDDGFLDEAAPPGNER